MGKLIKSNQEVEWGFQDFCACDEPGSKNEAGGDTATDTGGETFEFEPSLVKRP